MNAVVAVHGCHLLSDTASGKELPQCSTGNELVIGRRRANLFGTYCLRGEVTGFPGGADFMTPRGTEASALEFLIVAFMFRAFARVYPRLEARPMAPGQSYQACWRGNPHELKLGETVVNLLVRKSAHLFISPICN